MRVVKSFTHDGEPTVDVHHYYEGYAVDVLAFDTRLMVFDRKADALDAAQAMHNRAVRIANKSPRRVLSDVVNRAIANGSPVIVERKQ